MSRRFRLSILLLILFLAACAKNEEEGETEPEPVISVEAVAVLSTPIELKISSEGVLYPIQQESITPKISAPVKTDIGRMVRAVCPACLGSVETMMTRLLFCRPLSARADLQAFYTSVIKGEEWLQHGRPVKQPRGGSPITCHSVLARSRSNP